MPDVESARASAPQDLVALHSEVIATFLPDPVLHRGRSVRIGIGLRTLMRQIAITERRHFAIKSTGSS
ncbi:hypothetical protein ABIB14_003396 [Arthrobacter sp. UYEF3]